MKIETILNAMEHAFERVDWLAPQPAKFERKYNAFRDRLIRIDERNKMEIAQKDAEIDLLKAENMRHVNEIGVWEEMNEMIMGEDND